MVAAGKRSAAQAGQTPMAGGRKAARRSAPKVAEESLSVITDPCFKECEPFLALLDRADDLSEATCSMLRAAAPFSLKTPPSRRHELQLRLISALEKVLKDIEARSCEVVTAAKGRVDLAAGERSAAADVLSAAEAMVQGKTQGRDAADAEAREAATKVSEAKAKLAERRKKADGLDAEHAEDEKDKAAHEKLLSEAWATLKEKTKQSWQMRNKLIESVLRSLEHCGEGLEDSLKGALPIALKTKPEDRGAFALRAIEFCEDALKGRLEVLLAKVGGREEEASACAQAVQEAEEALAVEETLQGSKASALSSADQALKQEVDARMEAVKAADALLPKERELAEALDRAETELSGIKELVSKFELLRDVGLARDVDASSPVKNETEAVSGDAAPADTTIA